ncbi:hypothetical protein BCR42DRAFT_399436 [Absidia repens]|uniref:Transcription factor PAP1 domain-containing protein n=1 Tax=Absidia repens TaxID=90262 RepID=A0A1X2IZZ1_9FUNG|nr:hypothetical protein BCR42DRAFT_399436 [Absidia repens]
MPQVWDKLTEHPRFDEFDIDFLCAEMKRKAVCNDGKPCNNKSHQQKMQETIHQYYPSPSFC